MTKVLTDADALADLNGQPRPDNENMSQPGDGGCAFPQHPDAIWDDDKGMSLRDYFAAKALQGLMGNPNGAIQANSMSGWGLYNCTPESIAGLAYELAGAMLAAREGSE